MTNVYYNENDPKVFAWLRELSAGRHIAEGRIDERSIKEIEAVDLDGFSQCHFFAGIGGWQLACRLAGVADDFPIWTGSCPCQPFSGAGSRRGVADERHLWPSWYRLIVERQPGIIVGEQVSSGDGLAWLDVVFADLEAAGYACAALDIPAASIGAPHKRQRIYFVAYARGERREKLRLHIRKWRSESRLFEIWGASETMRLADDKRDRPQGSKQTRSATRTTGRRGAEDSGTFDPRSFEWIDCTDGKSRPTQRGIFPLAHVVPSRMVQLRGYGNAIVAEQAAAFLVAALEAVGEAIHA